MEDKYFIEKLLNENQKLNNKYNELLIINNENEKNIIELKKQIEQLSYNLKEYKKNNDEALEDYYENFNRLFLMFDLKAKGALKNTHLMCIELLDFVVNICIKYNLQYWLDYGNLLGAVRHKGFIPWDDDLDLGMMRKDFEMFLKIINSEIKNQGLEDIIKITINKKYTRNNKENIIPFIQIAYLPDPKHLLAGLDIFCYDYFAEPVDNIENKYYEAKIKYHRECLEGKDRHMVLQHYFNELNISIEEEKFIIPSLENVRSKWGQLKFIYYNTQDIFPLKKLLFNDKYYYCPKNHDLYLKSIYGNYHNIPKNLGRHQRVYNLLKDINSDDLFKVHLKKLRDINNNF